MASAVVKASSPNAPSAVYLDTFNKSADCATDKADIESACRGKSEEKKKNERTRQSGLRRHITQVMSKMDQVGQKIYRYDKGKPPSNSWMDDHCGGMWIKPQFNGMDDYAKEFEEFKQDLNNLGTTIDYYLKNTDKLLRSGLEQLASEAIETLGPDAVDDLVADKLMKDGILAALPIKGKFLVTLGRLAKIGVAGASYMDMAETLVEAVKSEGAKELLDDMKFLVDDAKDRFTEALKTWQKNPDAAMAELMSANAELNK